MQYLHCSFHGVGFLLYPPRLVTLDLDKLDEEFSGVKDELMDDLEAVATKIFRGDAESVTLVMTQFTEYMAPGTHRREMSIALLPMIEEGTKTPWSWWEAFGARHFPQLAKVAIRVLTKQVGIGAVERAHKVRPHRY